MSIGPGVLSLQSSLHSARAGSQVQLSGSGFKPATAVVITFASPPIMLTRSVVTSYGTFSTRVTVPTAAPPGTHHFEAAGVTPEGSPAQLVAAILVVGSKSPSGTSTGIEAVMISLAVLIPAGAWLTMGGLSRRRNRRLQTK